ncbi:hypothetical protein FHR20_000492 [Sphingomonas leidyi]|uniref:Uncharacterized protein n=1 Tax=Sphingomonas leidyi TaxID=68569 RepID=A0A7X5UWM8_9SPHN|nr:hypothetical protein [Sphingomonas leidyi]NIJ63561.1 hypothetical protein [Sphingomonas leidyi]
MFWTTGLAIILASMPAAQAEKKCAAATVRQGVLEMMVLIGQDGAEPMRVNWVWLQSPNADRSFVLDASYRPEGDALNAPSQLSIRSYGEVAEGLEGPPERLLWSPAHARPGTATGGWVRLQRGPESPIASASITMAQSGALAYRTEALEAARRGEAFRGERFSRDGKLLSSGTVRLPDEAVATALFLKARTMATAELKPCGPPVMLTPAPPRKD